MKMIFSMGVQKRSKPVTWEITIPLCNACANRERNITKVTLIPFLVGGLVIGLIVFIPAWLLSPEGTTPQTYGFSLVVGAFVALIAGMIGGTIVELILRPFAASISGNLQWKRPLTILYVFSDSENIVGMAARLAPDKKQLNLEFERDDIAREFKLLNPQEN
jgi:hypothetical protein